LNDVHFHYQFGLNHHFTQLALQIAVNHFTNIINLNYSHHPPLTSVIRNLKLIQVESYYLLKINEINETKIRVK